MTSSISSLKRQSGVFLLEALISVLIFLIGVIALVGVSLQAVNQVGQSKYRNDASYLASELVGEMWISAGTPSTFDATAWTARVAATLPSGAATITFPGGSTTQFDLDISWADTKDTSVTHHYRTSAQVVKN
jgi:type IV pilus assembly protein PilV